MKNMGYIVLAAVLASGTTFAQTAVNAGGADFVMSTTAAQRVTPAQRAAVLGLRSFATRFTGEAGTLPQGFPLDVHDVGELRHARIGWGFQIYDVTQVALMSGADMEAAAQPTGIWRYQIILHDRPVGLLTLAKTSQGWEVVSVGGAGLVNDIETVVGAYAGGTHTQFRYVRVPQATADFIQVKQGAAPARYAPLQAARGTLQVKPGRTVDTGLLEGDALQTQLRQVISRGDAH